jgi:NAD+ diphosphatase
MWKFSFSPLDRQSHCRSDETQQAKWRAQDNVKLVVFNEDLQLLMSPDGLHAANAAHHTNAPDQQHWLYLGHAENTPWFSAVVDSHDFELSFHQQWKSLRLALPLIAEPYASTIAYAKALHYWHQQHQYCGRCGEPTEIYSAGHELVCSHCDSAIYPRTDPAVIMSVTYKDELLLARQSSWPEHRYSVLAGFVEPGESFEQAVKREVWEESQLKVSNVEYLGSQPWPFPCSIMIGFTAEASSQNVHLLDQELEHAIWVNADNFIEQLESGDIILPSSGSISYHLVEHWAQSQGLNIAKYKH